MSEETQNTAVEEAVKEPQVSQDEKKTQEAVPRRIQSSLS